MERTPRSVETGYSKSANIRHKEPPPKKYVWGQCLKYEVIPEDVINKTASLPQFCYDPKSEETPIQQFYSGAHVLITGATGFMGKVIVEKLLVSCPKIEKVYLIIRGKKGQTMEERFDSLFKEPVFRRLREIVPDFKKKVVAVTGDCSQIRMGLSDKDYNYLTKVVSVIIHGAATVNFDEKIRMATHINVRGVREILQLSHKCKNLKSIVHISTAYSNCLPSENDVLEQFYPSAYDYKKLINLVEEESEEWLIKKTQELINPWPNTYSFTKQVAEEVVRREGVGLPLAVYRPAIVIASAKEPIKCWSDNIYGPTGIILGAGTGVLRVIHSDPDNYANVVPVDLAVNGVIAAAWKAHKDFKEEKGPTIYNFVSTARNPITWDEFSYWNSKYGRKWGTVKAVWYPFFLLIRNPIYFTILHFLLHTVPAYLADGFLYITGNQTKLIKGYKKIAKFLDVIAYFATKKWYFSDDNIVKLWNALSPKDKELYPFDIADLDWDQYSLTHLLGLRVYIAQDSIDTIPEGRAKYNRLLAQHIILLGVLSFAFLWLVSKLLGWSFI